MNNGNAQQRQCNNEQGGKGSPNSRMERTMPVNGVVWSTTNGLVAMRSAVAAQ